MKKKQKVNDLIKKYPKIFRQSKLPMTQTCMCWGVCTGEGWYKLLDNLCSRLQFDTDRNGYPQVEATQVKEKYGSLRFYFTSIPSKANLEEEKKWPGRLERMFGVQEGVISVFEQLSEQTCEKCGKMDGVTQTDGWIVSLCPECMKEYNEKNIELSKG